MANRPSFTWLNGWVKEARHIHSPNMGSRPAQALIDLVVVHSISLPPGVYGGPEIEQLFTNRLDWDAHPYFQGIRGLEVSSHFVIRRTGELLQFVSTWDAGVSQWRGRAQCNDDSIGVELEGLEGDTFEDAQYDTLTALCTCLQTAHPLRHIAGHEHIAPGRKCDPGPGFDWCRFRQTLADGDWCFPQTTFLSGNT